MENLAAEDPDISLGVGIGKLVVQILGIVGISAYQSCVLVLALQSDDFSSLVRGGK